ncbi:LysR family transcriptional regulator [Kitasatospora sp. NPDC056138]|uniref:LysR family transcriptional regulator n=1 Tax=Kitasatospora sp. NPDC056138 TaxID=3345724 RepID=UPI0035DA0397
MGGLDLRELECFLTLAEELHFGRTGERLFVSQSRVSQLIRSLESRIGARLLERTSRQVSLTPLGHEFLASLRPAYATLRATLDDAAATARGFQGQLRIGFQGSADAPFMAAVTAFQNRFPGCVTEFTEIPLSDPFGAVRRGEVDTAAVLLPMAEDHLVLGPVFSRQPQYLAVSRQHPLSASASVTAEALADTPLISIAEPAPGYWRQAQAPTRTPGGLPVPLGPAVRTLQEGISLAAGNRGAMLLYRPTSEYYQRRDISYVPVTGLPDSALGLIWHQDHETARIRAFAETVAEALG